MVKILGSDGAIGEDEISRREASEWPTSKVHDNLDKEAEFRVVVNLPAHLVREEHQEAIQLLIKTRRKRLKAEALQQGGRRTQGRRSMERGEGMGIRETKKSRRGRWRRERREVMGCRRSGKKEMEQQHWERVVGSFM